MENVEEKRGPTEQWTPTKLDGDDCNKYYMERNLAHLMHRMVIVMGWDIFEWFISISATRIVIWAWITQLASNDILFYEISGFNCVFIIYIILFIS